MKNCHGIDRKQTVAMENPVDDARRKRTRADTPAAKHVGRYCLVSPDVVYLARDGR